MTLLPPLTLKRVHYTRHNPRFMVVNVFTLHSYGFDINTNG